jgi:Tol biopolymer transport system component
LPLDGDRTPKPFRVTKYREWNARFSPDGRCIAFDSDEAGGSEVFVQSFPETGRPVRVSSNGGHLPEWRKDGKELYYTADDGKLTAAAVNPAGPLFQVSSSQPLFPMKTPTGSFRMQYLPSADGTRFLVNSRLEDTAPRVLTVVLNWQAAVRR